MHHFQAFPQEHCPRFLLSQSFGPHFGKLGQRDWILLENWDVQALSLAAPSKCIYQLLVCLYIAQGKEIFHLTYSNSRLLQKPYKNEHQNQLLWIQRITTYTLTAHEESWAICKAGNQAQKHKGHQLFQIYRHLALLKLTQYKEYPNFLKLKVKTILWTQCKVVNSDSRHITRLPFYISIFLQISNIAQIAGS